MESSTMFVPCPLSTSPNNSLDGVPRYLFRVSDPDSFGETSATEVCSPTLLNPSGKGEDLYQMRRTDPAAYLNDHLQWKCEKSSCNLMSWTSSLLFALQYAIYRHKGRRNQQDLSDIMILVIDTRQFKRGVFARDLEAMDALRELSTGYRSLDSLYRMRSSGTYYYGEYLSQGRVPIDPKRSCQVSMQELLDHGLFDICSELGDETHWTHWAKRVNELRSLIGLSTTSIRATDVQNIVRLASVFGCFALPMTIMLLGVSPRSLEGSSALVLDEIRKHYSERDISDSIWLLSVCGSEPCEVQRSLSLAEGLRSLRTLRIDDVVLHAQKMRQLKETKDEVDELAEGIDGLNVQPDHDGPKLKQKMVAAE